MDLSEDQVAKMLRSFQVNTQRNAEQATLPIRIPLGMEISRPRVDPLQDKIEKYLSDVPKLYINPKFQDLPDVLEDLVAIKTTFVDEEYLKMPSIMLERLSEDDTAVLGRKVLPFLRSGFSQQGVAALLVLAYQLKDPEDGSYVFQDYEITTYHGDKPYTEFPDNIMQTATAYAELPATKNVSHEAEVYSYMAASTLRLFTKSEENYIKAFNHITLGYSRFYESQLHIIFTAPNLKAIKTLAHYFSKIKVFKNTLYRLLYLGSEKKKSSGLQRFLYEDHLANTGIHIVSIFIRLCGVLSCKPGVLLSTLNCAEHERQVTALFSMLTLVTSKSDEHKRRMWRFGRLFDDAFMCHLQTRSCPSLVYTLASALKNLDSKSNQDILNIKQLEDINTENGRMYEAIGKMITKQILAHKAKGTR